MKIKLFRGKQISGFEKEIIRISGTHVHTRDVSTTHDIGTLAKIFLSAEMISLTRALTIL